MRDAPLTCGIPVLSLICSGAIVSVGVSLSSGLIMYFESISSLDRTLSQTSASDMEGLKHGILDIMDMTRFVGKVNFLSSFELGYNETDVRLHARVQEDKGVAAISAISNMAGDGLVLLSNPDADGYMRSPEVVVSLQCAHPLQNGGRELFSVSGAGAMPAVPSATGPRLPLDLYRVDNLTLQKERYGTLDVSYHAELLRDWVPGDRDLPSGFDAVEASPAGTPAPAVAERWREGMLRTSKTSGFVYAYGSWDVVYRPPPPPHPWSKYRAIVKYSQFFYSAWREPLQEYALRAPQGTHVVVYDPVADVVYASTQGGELVDQNCPAGDLHLGLFKSPCVFRTANLSQLLRDAVTGMAGVPVQQMVKKTLDGEEHFARRDTVSENLQITWVRPVSFVEGEVNEAFVMLIVFTVIMMVLDIIAVVAEVLLVALPLRDAERVILLAGSMLTEEAQRVLAPYQSKTFIVSELRGLVAGMSAATARLHEFRAFMPQSLHVESDSAGQQQQSMGKPGDPDGVSSGGSFSMLSSLSVSAGGGGRFASFAATGLSSRAVSLVVSNIRGFRNLPAECTVQVHSVYIAATLEQATQHCGLVEDMSGDQVLLSFGAKGFLPSHMLKAVRCAAMLRAAHSGDSDVNFGVACGRAQVGNLGCDTLKKRCIVGAVACDVRTIERCGSAWDMHILCDASISEAASGYYHTRAVGLLQLQGMATLVSELVGTCVSQGNIEWMYDLENALLSNPHTTSNLLVSLICRGDFQRAGEVLKDEPVDPPAVSLYNLAMQLGRPPVLEVLPVTPLLCPDSNAAFQQPSSRTSSTVSEPVS